MSIVYLAGPITTDDKHISWRKDVENRLRAYDIRAISPIRDKDPSDWTNDGYEGKSHLPYANGGYVARDLFDIKRSDIILINMLDVPDRQSIGSWFEFGYAYACDIPTVIVADDPMINKHPFVYKTATKLVKSIDEAIEYIVFFLHD